MAMEVQMHREKSAAAPTEACPEQGPAGATAQCEDCVYARVFADEPLALCLQPGRQHMRRVVYAGAPPCDAAILGFERSPAATGALEG
jgi:hypothetical protein